jgi:hypothetical protein
LQQLIVAIRQVKNPAVQIVICGDGAAKQALLEMAAGYVMSGSKGRWKPMIIEKC